MDTLFLGISGIILTLVFGIYSIWSYIKSKKTVKLEFQNIGCYRLFRDDVNRLNIEITHNKKSLSSNLILLKANLINSGKIDIDKNRIYSPVKIMAPEGYNWLEANINYKPEGSTTKIEIIDNRIIQLDWDLLKRKEYITIESICELTANGKKENSVFDFYDKLEFDFRITDIDKIPKSEQYSSSLLSNRFFRSTLGMMFIMIGFTFGINHFKPLLFEEPIKFNIDYVISDGNNSFIGNLRPKNGTNIILYTREKKETLDIQISEFNTKYKIEKIDCIHKYKYENIKSLAISVVYIILGIYLMAFYKRKKQPLTKNI